MKLIPQALSQGIGRQLLMQQKNMPTILFGAGVVGMIGSTVLACRATLKMDDVVEEHRMNMVPTKSPDYPEDERKKDVAHIYGKTTIEIARLYAPSILLGAASIAMLAKSHNMLMKRNAALTAAYVVVDEAFKKYRSRVIEKYGEEQDQEFMYSTEEVEVLNEKGRLEIVKRPGEASMYARFFDETSSAWSKDPEVNLAFIRSQQQWVNNLLQARGHVTLNEVYDELGMMRSKAGMVVGWVISDEGDNFVDFGISENTPNVRAFVNGQEASILLDFNVDGVIYDKLDDHQRRHWVWQK